jgi:DNA-binding GntR family transcriptional regulator
MSAADTAYAYAKQRILDGRFPGGEILSEGEVAAAVGLSRTPVREAFLRLEVEGLLRLYPKRGALVVPVSVGEVESVHETRVLVERHAIAKVIAMGARLEAAFDAALERQEALVAAGDSRAFVEADHEFHRLFVREARNPILLQLHDSLRDRQSRMGLVAIARDGTRIDRIIAEHRELAHAVTAGDAKEALAIIDRHLDATLTLLRGASRLS